MVDTNSFRRSDAARVARWVMVLGVVMIIAAFLRCWHRTAALAPRYFSCGFSFCVRLAEFAARGRHAFEDGFRRGSSFRASR